MPDFNPLIAGQSPPPVPAVQAWAKAYRGGAGPLIDLSQAVPGYPPHPDLLGWLGDAARSVDNAGYGAIEGDGSLRDAYAAHVSALYAAVVTPANVHITSGCNQAFFASAMAVAGPGDTVLMTNPCYFNHETTLAMLGVRIGYVDCDAGRGFLPDPARLAAAIVPGVKAFALVSPNNPTGAVYPPHLLEQIFDICRAKGIWLIVDETYRDFLPPGAERPHGLLARDGWEDNLIQLYSFSKSFCIPGHRLGAITAGPKLVAEVAKIMDNLQICAPRPPQQAVAVGLPALAAWREGNRVEIAARADALRETMAALPGWDLRAVGAYFGFVRHPFGATPSRVVAEALATRAGVLVIPGEYFGRGQEAYLRFAFANADAGTIRSLGERLTLPLGL
jgi:aspartate/methionine/tyrosine aminotransferase